VLPPHRQLSVLWMILYRATPEQQREMLDDQLAEVPAALVTVGSTTTARGRRPADWGDGDDDAIEQEAGLAALAVMRGVTPRR
jgi:hypothetical protein